MSIIVDPRDFLAAFGAIWVLWLICNRCFSGLCVNTCIFPLYIRGVIISSDTANT